MPFDDCVCFPLSLPFELVLLGEVGRTGVSGTKSLTSSMYDA